MADISTANLDSSTDSPAAARVQLLEAVQRINAFGHTTSGEGAALVGVEGGGTVQRFITGRPQDIRRWCVGDGTTDDFAALQTAISTGLPLFWPAGVKTRILFTSTNAHLFVTGTVNWSSGDKFSSGILLDVSYDMGNVHAPLFCFGISSVGSTATKVKGTISNLGWFLKAGSSKFERCCHIYGMQDFTVSDCYADFSTVTYPAADGGHPSGYQAAGWFSSNVQGTFATGQTRDRNFKFLRNVGFASCEYQNAESVGITRCDGVQYLNNYLRGWADDMAVHECTDVLMQGNYYAAVSGRLYIENSQYVKVLGNTIEPVLRPVAGTYLGSTRSYIHANMITQYAVSTTDEANRDISICDNTIRLPSGGYCTGAIVAWGVQDGLVIRGNQIHNWGANSPVTGIAVATLFRTGWTGPSGNPDFSAGGAVKMRAAIIDGNTEIGTGWIANEGNIGVTVATGGAATDIIGPVIVDRNMAGGYFLQNEGITCGKNFGNYLATDPFKNISIITLWDKQPPVWVGMIPSSAAVNNTNFPQATPTFYTTLDSDGLKFIAQRAGRVIGAHMQLTANMTAGNNAVLRILKNGTQIGSDTDSATNSPTTNPARYTWNFAGVASMTFVEGDKIECLLTIRLAQGATSIVGRINLVALYN